ncbi:MAG: hypothetical protein LBF66_01945 [Holosporales bacterium]|jgi:hypothetical protein|nr:hypothetical protein [Holosporales bacterium]
MKRLFVCAVLFAGAASLMAEDDCHEGGACPAHGQAVGPNGAGYGAPPADAPTDAPEPATNPADEGIDMSQFFAEAEEG